MAFSVRRLSDVAIEVRCKYGKDFSQSFLLTSDHHYDSTKCDRNKLKKHHNAAKEKDAGIFCFGDLFDVMQGRSDRRSSKGELREEYKGGNYYDLVVNDAVEWYSQYAENYILISPGNHETSIRKYQETDVLSRLVNRINEKKKSSIQEGTYSGWVKFVFEHESGGSVRSFWLFYHHGYGGGGPVTRGVIQTNRKAVYLPDADVIVSGHVHESWHVPIPQERIDATGNVSIRKQHHLSIPGYNEEYLCHKGWHIERGAPPKPTGSYWMQCETKQRKGKTGRDIQIRFIEAD
jgi:hypothetical protein